MTEDEQAIRELASTWMKASEVARAQRARPVTQGGPLGAWFDLGQERERIGMEHGGCLRVGVDARSANELTAVASLLRYFLCLITVIPPLTLAAEAAWGGWHGGGGGWRGGAPISAYYGCHDYGYPYNAATVIRLTGGYGYAPNYSYDYEYPCGSGPYLHRHLYAAVRGVRRVRAYRPTAAASSAAPTTRTPSSPSKREQATPADSTSPRNVWSPMTVPVSPSSADEPPKTDADSTEWAKKFELRLNRLSSDMGAASALLQQEGFRVDSGNKSATGWFLTAHDRNQRRGSIKLQSDGTKIVLTVTG
jgi:hypothetical protein